jgi:N6-adenosine-specific RNA methylase IME4
MTAWGFIYRQILIWHKLDGNLGGSVAPNSAEFLLVGVRGNPSIKHRLKTSVIQLAHSARHSQKPREFHFLIEQADGDGPRLEIFARRKLTGWDVWGNEVEKDVEMKIEYQLRLIDIIGANKAWKAKRSFSGQLSQSNRSK